MSNALFPDLPGLDIEIKRTTQYSTLVQSAASGKEVRASFSSLPRWTYELTINFLRKAGYRLSLTQDEVTTLAGFFAQVRGSWDNFLLVDPASGTSNQVPFGSIVSGVTTYQLLDNEGYPAGNLQGPAYIFANGAPLSPQDATVDPASGLVTITGSFAPGQPLTWTGVSARRVRFVDDSIELTRFLALAWEGGTIKLISVK